MEPDRPNDEALAKALGTATDEWEAREDRERQAAAPTEQCVRHVADTGNERCIRCSKPLSLMTTAQQKLAIMRRDRPVLALDVDQTTEQCVRHVADTGNERCIRCSKPLSLMTTAQQKLAIMRRDRPVLALDVDRTIEAASTLLDESWNDVDKASSDAVPATPPESEMVRISRLWADRALTMAGKDGMTLPSFIELLIKRQWVASGGGRG